MGNIGSKTEAANFFLIKMNCRNLKGNFDVFHKKSGFNILKLLKLPKEHAVEILKLELNAKTNKQFLLH